MATINTNSVASLLPAATQTSNALAPTGKAEKQKNQFLQLLVAQLKGQNPLDPKDGTEFVSQLAQFSSLEQLINIRTDLDGMSKSSTTSTESSTPAAATQANPLGA